MTSDPIKKLFKALTGTLLAAAAARAPAARARAQAGPSPLPWLRIQAGTLRESAGRALRLTGLHSDGNDRERDLRDLQLALPALRGSGLCIALTLRVLAQLRPEALSMLDEAIGAYAAAGAHTLLRIDARLWLRGHHTKLARRYAGNSAVLFALLGRKALADRLAAAALALRSAHPSACVWLPLESVRTVFAFGKDPQCGLLWDATQPQAPRGPVLQASLRAPMLLDGWQPGAHHTLADQRLMRLCSEGGIGWLVRSRQPLVPLLRGQPAPTRTALALRHALAHTVPATPRG